MSSGDSLEAIDIDFLYPTLDDPSFNERIAKKKEFFDTRYDGRIKPVEQEAERLCNADFELAPHQLFVRNFLSFATPYNGLLLYHGLGSGKTCSAIGVGEEMREYLKQMGISQRIIVVATPNVQDNFRTQLFDARRLKLVDGLWNIRACTGNRFLKEINPMNMRGLSKQKVEKQIKRIINASYLFLGYIEFANYIAKVSAVSENEDARAAQNRLAKHFRNRLVIIDEIHNVRIADDAKDKKVAVELEKLVKKVRGIRLVLLSATPMYNSYREIIWLLNLLRKNDSRTGIKYTEVFDKDGHFKINEEGEEIGKTILQRKATGYVSFVRGENPYAFPYRIFPKLFDKERSIFSFDYPQLQLNGKPIRQPIELVDVYMGTMGEYQTRGYNYIIQQMKNGVSTGEGGYRELPNFDNMETFGYTLLQRPLEALNIVFPDERLDEGELVDAKELVGKAGLSRIMTYSEAGGMRRDYKYKTGAPRIFEPSKIGNYSGKIRRICECIDNSKGIVLIYSQYIDGGLIPMALALEELGMTRYTKSGSKARSLLKNAPKHASAFFKAHRYAVITGDKSISPSNLDEMNVITADDNVHGDRIKVVMISQAGAEGLDFVGIRQVHVLEPWYNMNRIEQIIGRAVRWCSHKKLPFKERNTEVYLHATNILGSEEAVDLYVYRVAESKAIQIGRVARALKEGAIDCLLNLEQVGFTEENVNQTVEQQLSSGEIIMYRVGDKPYSSTCDYMSTCQYECAPTAFVDEENVSLDTFSEAFIATNSEKIIQRIRDLFLDKFVYTRLELISLVNLIRQYPMVQIDAALSQMTQDGTELVTDMYGRIGHIINVSDLYLFQPIELRDKFASLSERKIPIAFKHQTLEFPVTHDADQGKEIDSDEDADDTFDINVIINPYSTVFGDKAEDDSEWYTYARKAIPVITNISNFSLEDIEKAVVAHIIETLPIALRKRLAAYVLLNSKHILRPLQLAKEHFSNNIVLAGGENLLIMLDNGENRVFSINSKLSPAPPVYEGEALAAFAQRQIAPSMLNLIVGFISVFKGEQYVFKTKNLERKGHKGARCDQSGKSEALRLLMEITKGEFGNFSIENTKGQSQRFFCVLQELVLRVYNLHRKEELTWFLSPEQAFAINIEKLTRK